MKTEESILEFTSRPMYTFGETVATILCLTLFIASAFGGLAAPAFLIIQIIHFSSWTVLLTAVGASVLVSPVCFWIAAKLMTYMQRIEQKAKSRSVARMPEAGYWPHHRIAPANFH